MNTNSLPTPQRPNKYQLGTIFVLLVAACLSNACTGGNTNKSENANAPASPSTQTAAPTATPPGLGDKPIIITGGSLEIDFDHTRDYLRNPAGGTTFVSPSNKIEIVHIYDDDTGTSSTPIVIVGSATVEIWAKSSGSPKKVFEIKDDTASNSVSINFLADDFKPDDTRRHGKSRRHYSHRFQLEDIKVKDDNNNFVSYIGRCSKKNKCNIEVGGRP
jgi:hypothetical protein